MSSNMAQEYPRTQLLSCQVLMNSQWNLSDQDIHLTKKLQRVGLMAKNSLYYIA